MKTSLEKQIKKINAQTSLKQKQVKIVNKLKCKQI